MPLAIKTWRDPYEAGFSPTKPTSVSIEEGLTVLVGCNGAGKTTLINNIEEECRKQDIPCHKYDNLKDGLSLGAILGGVKEFDGDNFEMGMVIWSSSEGEAIKLNIMRQSTIYKDFFEKGIINDFTHRLSSVFNKSEEKVVSNKRVLLYDATDSGLSIDTVCEIKNLFKILIEDSTKYGIELYIIIAANEYELADKEACLDVNEGKYVTFNSYPEFKRFILASRKKKEKRIDNQRLWAKKQETKERAEFYKKQKDASDRINEAFVKYCDSKTKNRWSLEYKIDDIYRNFRTYTNNLRILSSSETRPYVEELASDIKSIKDAIKESLK